MTNAGIVRSFVRSSSRDYGYYYEVSKLKTNLCFPLVLLVACDETTQTVSAPRIANKSPNVEVCDCQDCEPRKTRVLTRYVHRAETFSCARCGSTPTRTTSRVVRRLRCPPTCPRSRARPPPRSARRASPGRFAAVKGARRSRHRRPDSLFRRPRVQFRFFHVPKRRSTRRLGHEARAS